jgi:hypothetical protein
MNHRRPWKFGAGTVTIIVLALLLLAVLATRKSRTLTLNQTLQLDDFCFTVVEARSLRAGPSTLTEAGGSPSAVDYLVRLKIDNKALRVPFTFGGQSLAIADAARTGALIWPRAEGSSVGQSTPPVPHVLKPGESATYDYVFTIPGDTRDPRLRIAPGGWSGEIFEWLFFGRKAFQLPWNG